MTKQNVKDFINAKFLDLNNRTRKYKMRDILT